MTTTVGDTEPPPPPPDAAETETETDTELARPAPTTAPSTTVEPTDLEAEPDKDQAETTPADDEDEDPEAEDEDTTDGEETPDTTDGEEESEGGEGEEAGEDPGESDDSSGGVNDPDLSGLDEHAQASVAYVNERRGENGLNRLSADADLTAMADRWARQMIAEQDLHHNPNLGEEKPDRFGAVGENIAFSFDPTNIDDMWWNSDGHRENMLGANYTHIGVAFVRDEEGTTWAVQVFGG